MTRASAGLLTLAGAAGQDSMPADHFPGTGKMLRCV